ncbi:MAG: pitrilysin family protein [Litorilinea sp.]
MIVQESRAAPVVAFFVFYRVGSRHETPGLTGASHWVEHMLFRGTPRFPPGALDRAMARAGAVFNALTSPDITVYYETLPAAQLPLAIDAESDRMCSASFDPEDFDAERTVILSELEGAENSAYWLLMDEVRAVAYQVHGYHHPTIGWRADLVGLTRDELYAYYRRFYTPENAVIAAVGDFDAEDALQQIRQAFAPIPRAEKSSTARRVVEPVQRAERRVTLYGSEPTAHVLAAFHAVDARHADFFAFAVMDAILSGAKGMGLFGEGINSRKTRLHQALVETELAVSAGTWFEPTLDPGLFWLYAAHSPEVAHATVEAALFAEAARLQAGDVTTAELQRAVKQTRAQFAYSRESVSAQAYWLGFSAMLEDPAWAESWSERLAAVTLADVQRVATDCFVRTNRTVGWFVPEADDAMTADAAEDAGDDAAEQAAEQTQAALHAVTP